MNPLSLLFRTGNQILYHPCVLLKIADLEFIIPVDITISLRKKIVITEIYGADFSVKEDFGCADYQIRIEGKIGNTEGSIGAKLCGIDKQVPALEFISRLAELYTRRQPLEISDISREYVGNLLNYATSKIDRAFDLPFGLPEEPEGLLNRLGITKIVLLSLDIQPLPGGFYHFTIEAISEISDEDILEINKPNLFLEEQ